MNRGQVLYRVAELMEGRRDQFVAEVAAAEGLRDAEGPRASSTGPSTAGSGTPAGPTRSPRCSAAATRSRRRTSTSPSPRRPASSGVVAPETSSLLGLVSRLAPPLVSGNAVVLLASETRPLPAVTLTEVLATSDVPGRRRQRPDRAQARSSSRSWPAHADVDALDTWGVPDAMRRDTELLAAEDIKRLLRRPTTVDEARFDWLDDRATERPEWIAAFLEMKTVWHPIGV